MLRNLTRRRAADARTRLEPLGMRDNFSFNMLPIVEDSMDYIPGVRSVNLSSNGYYGYQPPLPRSKEESHCRMEVQFEAPQSQTTGSRKRAWDFGSDFREFKKRRQNEKITTTAKKKTDDLLEELLQETHGCALYHWNSDGL